MSDDGSAEVPPDGPESTPHPRRDRRGWIPVAVVIVGVVVFVVLVNTSPPTDDTSGAPPTTDAAGFVLDGPNATLTFGRDGDEASVAFGGGEEGEFTFDLDGDGALAEGDGGSFELTGSFPDAWPDGFPVPEGAEPVRGSIVDAGTLQLVSVTMTSPTPADEVVAYYEDALAHLDPIVDAPAGESTSIGFEGDWSGFLTVSEVDGGTVIAVQLFVEPSGG